MLAAYSTGQVINITPLDVEALDVIAYDAIGVTEPRSLILLMSSLTGVIATRRRNRPA